MPLTLAGSLTVGPTPVTYMTINNIPATGKDLIIYASIRTTASPSNAVTRIRMVINDVVGTSRTVAATGSSYYSFQEGAIIWGLANTNTALSNTFSNTRSILTNYTSSTHTKRLITESIGENNTSTISYDNFNLVASTWENTGVINRLYLVPENGDFAQNSTIQIYIAS